MKFFERSFENNIKKDTEGRSVYFPWSFLGKGRVIKTPAVEERMKRFVRLYNAAWAILFFLIIFLSPDSQKTLYLLMSLAIMPLILLLASERILSGCPVSALRLSWKEHMTGAARRTPVFLLLILLICSFIMVFIAGTGIFTADGIKEKAILILGTLFFGAMFAAILYAFGLKSEGAGDAAAGGGQ